MLKVGITGGIGSGKSIVCRVFETLGIPVFNSDEAAKYLMENNTDIIDNIKILFGEEIYINGNLDTKKIAALVFNQPELLQQLNAIVHPATKLWGFAWQKRQASPYSIKESALIFETGINAELDVVIGVTAPLPLRIKRTMNRNNITSEQVLDRIAQQMDDEQKMKKCKYIIINDEKQAILPQILHIHNILINYPN